jgi:hypothetical protein
MLCIPQRSQYWHKPAINRVKCQHWLKLTSSAENEIHMRSRYPYGRLCKYMYPAIHQTNLLQFVEGSLIGPEVWRALDSGRGTYLRPYLSLLISTSLLPSSSHSLFQVMRQNRRTCVSCIQESSFVSLRAREARQRFHFTTKRSTRHDRGQRSPRLNQSDCAAIPLYTSCQQSGAETSIRRES